MGPPIFTRPLPGPAIDFASRRIYYEPHLPSPVLLNILISPDIKDISMTTAILPSGPGAQRLWEHRDPSHSAARATVQHADRRPRGRARSREGTMTMEEGPGFRRSGGFYKLYYIGRKRLINLKLFFHHRIRGPYWVIHQYGTRIPWWQAACYIKNKLDRDSLAIPASS